MEACVWSTSFGCPNEEMHSAAVIATDSRILSCAQIYDMHASRHPHKLSPCMIRALMGFLGLVTVTDLGEDIILSLTW